MKMTISKLLSISYKKLSSAGIESYMLDSQIILAFLLNKNRIYLHINKFDEVSEEIEKKFNELIELRSTGYPVKYITKSCEFMGMTFHIEEGVLIPRNDTEILVEVVINKIKKENLKNICDVCSGSGVIGISLMKEIKDLNVQMFDMSDRALEVSRKNAKKLNVIDNALIVKSNLLNYALENGVKYDLIVSNPPYIKSKEIQNLMKDVKDFEPVSALDGGEDGLCFYRKITKESISCLNENGFLCYEIGYDERFDVINILKENGFKDIECYKDLSNYDRVVLGRYKT